MLKPIYLDHAAAAPIHSEVLDLYIELLREGFGNPSATGHHHGSMTYRLVEHAREEVAALAGADPSGVVFTSGTTESNQLALTALDARAGGVVTTNVEHPAIAEPLAHLERLGLGITRIGCDSAGQVEASQVLSACDQQTQMVSVIHGHNETGAIFDIDALLGAATRSRRWRLHVDAAQTAMTEDLSTEVWGPASVSLSSHKIGGPKGTAALVCSLGVRQALAPLMRGGGQEQGIRPGTSNAPAIAAFGRACTLTLKRRLDVRTRLKLLAESLLGHLQLGIPDIQIVGPGLGSKRLPHILTLRIPGVAAQLLQAEVRNEVSLATGSACSSTRRSAPRSLLATGMSEEAALEAIRLSLGPTTTEKDIVEAGTAIIAAVNRLTRGVK